MSRLAAPVIGAINVAAITGGFELALTCDLMIASTRASFADTHARVGVLPGWGLSQRLARIVGPGRAKELSLTGNFLDAGQAAAWGLVNRVVEPDALLPTALKLASDMLSVCRRCWSPTRAWAADLRGADIESRRQQIAQRGRARSTRPDDD